MHSAALLDRLAILDLETTGLDPARDEVIELGVVFVEHGAVAQRISRLFCPKRPLPAVIRRLTGLCDAELANQPPFSSYLPTLAGQLDGWTVVAHNAAFEQSFLRDLLGSIRAPVLDSCELLHYLYPELESHSLESLIRWAGVGEQAAHRALRDCEDTLAVLHHALGRCVCEGRADDVADLLEALAPSRRGPASVGNPSAPEEPLLALLENLHRACRVRSSPRAIARESPVTFPTTTERSANPLGQSAPSPQNSPLCQRCTLEATGSADAASDYPERAARAYLRAFVRRSPEGNLGRLSHWFQSRFPALSPLVALVSAGAASSLGEGCQHFRPYFASALQGSR